MKDVSPAAAYASLLPILVASARTAGYALAPHGSMARDLDLIAVPWTDEATSAEDLILRLIAASGGHLTPCPLVAEHANKHSVAVEKPHGRRAWSIHLGHQLYLDVSVMPRVPAAKPQEPFAP